MVGELGVCNHPTKSVMAAVETLRWTRRPLWNISQAKQSETLHDEIDFELHPDILLLPIQRRLCAAGRSASPLLRFAVFQ